MSLTTTLRILGLMFIAFKLLDLIAWSWLWVLAPFLALYKRLTLGRDGYQEWIRDLEREGKLRRMGKDISRALKQSGFGT